MDFEILAGALRDNGYAIGALFRSVELEQMRWKPAEDRWSLLEVLNHLLDEERNDFRQIIRKLIEDPKIDWPNNSPMEWVTSRNYNGRDPIESLHLFERERAESVEWLEKTDEPDYDTKYAGSNAPPAPLRIGDIMSSWIAHDYFHLRQSTNLKWEYLMRPENRYTCWYAGEYQPP